MEEGNTPLEVQTTDKKHCSNPDQEAVKRRASLLAPKILAIIEVKETFQGLRQWAANQNKRTFTLQHC